MLKCRFVLCLKYVSIYARWSIDIDLPIGIIEHKFELRNGKIKDFIPTS
jgi:hypothetical protein